MSDENNSQLIEAPKPIAADKGLSIWQGIGAIVVTIGGVVTFALLTTPTRLAGATRSARLRWQQRQQEVQQAIESACSLEKKDATKSAKDEKSVPSDP